MWVFGYGSLIWDGWEATRGCIRHVQADVRGYCRVFNKASVKNWGNKQFPCPTLSLTKRDSAHCRGVAFEFPDNRRREILNYLTEREGKGFALIELPARIETGGDIVAIVPVYDGTNLIAARGVDEIAKMVVQASGTQGQCLRYVKGVAEELHRLGIEDPAVGELWRTLQQRGTKP